MDATESVAVAAYARVSTGSQTPEAQLHELRSAVERRHDWALVDEYVDRGSGIDRDRPELERLLSDARAGEIDLVVVWRLDRLARSTIHLLEVLEQLHRWSVGFVSLREGVDTTTPAGRAFATFLGAIGELERHLTIDRVRAGMAAARARGVHVGRPPSTVPMEAAQALLADGHSERRVARMLHVSRSTLRRRLGAADSTD